MAPLSLKIVQDNGAVTRKVKLDPNLTVREATQIVRGKANLPPGAKAYALFLRSLDNDLAGIWLEDDKKLSFYLLKDGDQLDYMSKIRNLRVRMLDGAEKTLQVDQSQLVSDLMINICSKIGITNHEEYGLCFDEENESEGGKENKSSAAAGHSGTLTLKKKSQLKERDLEFEQLSIKLKTDDNVDWIDSHKTLSEACISPTQTLLLKRRLFYSDRNVDSRDPIQLNLLYVQARDNILNSRHPVTEDKAADCKVRWINIRDVHRRILRKSISGKLRPKRAYKYDKHLEFMRNYYKEVVTVDNNVEEEFDDAEKSSVTNTSSAWSDVVIEYDNEDSSNDAESQPLKKRKKTVKLSKQIDNFEEVELPVSSLNEKQELDVSDPVDAFLISIGATLKRFSPYHLNLAKSKIFHIVQEHDLQQIVERPSRSDSLTISTESPIYFQG